MRRALDSLGRPEVFDRLVVVALVALYVNVVSGALVRVTNSGLGCPDWPLCNGRPVPAAAGHSVIEFSNRVLALGVIVATLLLAVSAWRTVRRTDRWRFRLAMAVAVGTFAQGPLGGITVLTDLHPVAVMTHFLLAVLMISVATVLLVDTRGWAAPWGPPRWLGPAGWALAAWCGALIATGAVVTMSGTHPGGDDVPRLWNLLDAAYVHVRVAASFVAALVLYLVALSRVARPPARVANLAWAVVLAAALQVAIGEWQWRSQLPWWLVLAHVATATALWVAVVALARAAGGHGPAPARPASVDAAPADRPAPARW